MEGGDEGKLEGQREALGAIPIPSRLYHAIPSPPISRTPPLPGTPQIEDVQLAAESSEKRCLMAVGGAVYDVTSFLDEHPGKHHSPPALWQVFFAHSRIETNRGTAVNSAVWWDRRICSVQRCRVSHPCSTPS